MWLRRLRWFTFWVFALALVIVVVAIAVVGLGRVGLDETYTSAVLTMCITYGIPSIPFFGWCCGLFLSLRRFPPSYHGGFFLEIFWKVASKPKVWLLFSVEFVPLLLFAFELLTIPCHTHVKVFRNIMRSGESSKGLFHFDFSCVYFAHPHLYCLLPTTMKMIMTTITTRIML